MSLVGEKSRQFAIRIVKLYQYLLSVRKEGILSKQLLRAGTSIGANIAEADYAISRNEFLAKVYIALKEAAETIYWLSLMYETGILTERQYKSILKDAEELRKMLSSITKTVKTTIKTPHSSLLTPN